MRKIGTFTGHGTATQTDRYWNHSWYIWNNTGDTAILRNQNGTTIDSCTYKGTSQGYVFCLGADPLPAAEWRSPARPRA